jgi:predicted nucleic acid-binding protein
MRTVFVDTLHWVAHINPRDQWHERAMGVESQLGRVRLVTTESVLIEFLNFLASYKPEMRQASVNLVREILDDPEIETIPHTEEAFLSGLALYEDRLDKGYSLTDCISMNAMRERGLVEVLTHDKHFAQEGFSILL